MFISATILRLKWDTVLRFTPQYGETFKTYEASAASSFSLFWAFIVWQAFLDDEQIVEIDDAYNKLQYDQAVTPNGAFRTASIRKILTNLTTIAHRG